MITKNTTKNNLKKKINKIFLFYNNYRGFFIKKALVQKGFEVFSIITTKFINKKIIPQKSEKLMIITSLKKSGLINFLKEKKADLFISAGFPHIFNDKFFNLSKYGLINLHAGKVPKYRGGSPLNWQIINDEKQIGVSVLKVNSKIDAGDIICSSTFKNIKSDTIKEIHDKANKLFIKLTFAALNKITNKVKFKKQANIKSYFYQRNDNNSKINWHQSNNTVYNFVRALTHPYAGAYYLIKNKKYRIFKCKQSKLNPKLSSGVIFKRSSNKRMFIKCKKNSVEIINSDLLKISIKKLNYEII